MIKFLSLNNGKSQFEISDMNSGFLNLKKKRQIGNPVQQSDCLTEDAI